MPQMAVRKNRRPASKPALTPDALIATGTEGRIRLIEKRPPRRKPRPAPGRPASV
jgi:hypothetical protein